MNLYGHKNLTFYIRGTHTRKPQTPAQPIFYWNGSHHCHTKCYEIHLFYKPGYVITLCRQPYGIKVPRKYLNFPSAYEYRKHAENRVTY
jgi:hypothetical protein